MFATLKDIQFFYHPWSLMYVIAFFVAAVLLMIIKSSWYQNFINRNQHLPNAKYGIVLFNKLVFAVKATIVLAIFCFFMTNLNLPNSALVLSASCGKLKSQREGKLYIEDVSSECGNLNNKDCLNKVLSNSEEAKDENLKIIKMVWPFKLSINNEEHDFNANKICKKQNLEKLMMHKLAYNKNLFGFVTKMKVLN